MEIPVKYCFYSQGKIVQLLTKKLETVQKSYNVKVLNILNKLFHLEII